MSETAGSPKPPTREQLIELAAEVFATEGYASASVRDLTRRRKLTSGAIYANFRNKADLLAEAVDARIAQDLEVVPADRPDAGIADIVDANCRSYPERAVLRALLLEGAVAAKGDEQVRERLHDAVARHLETWGRSPRWAELEPDPSVDLEALATMFWSADLGLAVLEALGVQLPDPDAWADLAGRLVGALAAPAADAAPATSASRRRRRGRRP